MKYTTHRTDQALARAAKAMLSLDLTRDQADAVLNILRDVVAVVALDVAENVGATLIETVRKNIERRAGEAT